MFASPAFSHAGSNRWTGWKRTNSVASTRRGHDLPCIATDDWRVTRSVTHRACSPAARPSRGATGLMSGTVSLRVARGAVFGLPRGPTPCRRRKWLLLTLTVAPPAIEVRRGVSHNLRALAKAVPWHPEWRRAGPPAMVRIPVGSPLRTAAGFNSAAGCRGCWPQCGRAPWLCTVWRGTLVPRCRSRPRG
jgi:hypothetical protein